MRILLTAVLFLYYITSQGQIVAIDPPFFDVTSDITVTYDATQGSGGLEGVNQVYMHTGLITESGGPGVWNFVQGNWGTDDPKVKMTYIGDNKHTLSFNIEEFYGIEGMSITAVQLAFVFRNVDGSKEGKTESLGDIFVDFPVLGAFTGFFQAPSSNFIIGELGGEIEVRAVFSESADLKLFDNDELLYEGTGTEIDHTISINSAGNHVVRFEADNGEDVIQDQFSYVVNPDLIIQDPPNGTKHGLTRLTDESVRLSLYAPQKDFIYVIGNFSNWSLNTNYFMKRSITGNSWWIDIDGLDPTEEYTYQYFIDGDIVVADPLSELVLDQVDTGIPEENFPDLMPFPKEFTSGQVSYFKTTKEDYPWQVTDFQKPAKEDLVIYELLMRDFTHAKNYQTLMDTLPYLAELGINAIELMPVQEFENNQSWGYNPNYHMALDKFYGTPDAFKAFIDKAHELGIAIIIDVVYNHAFGQSPLVRMYWDAQGNRPAGNSPYFNQQATHLYNVGFDFNHESNATEDFVKQVMDYWITEYRVDGFRFDLSKGFTQNISTTDSEMAAYDPTRISILKNYADFVWDLDPEFYVILEHFADNSEERDLANYGMMLWGNSNHNYNEGTMGYNSGSKSDFSWISYKKRNWSVPHVIGYMESHDEERLMYKNLQYGNSSGDYNVKDIVTGLERNELAATFFFTIPGPKMIWQFGELGYDFSINRCENGTVNDNCRLSPKPIRWDYQFESERKDLFNVYSRLIHLKKTEDLLSTQDFDLSVSGPVKRIRLNGENANAIVIGNFDVEFQTIDPQFHNTGTWYDYMREDSIEVTDVNAPISLAPGEYHLYIDKRVDFTSNINSEVPYFIEELLVFPNPSDGYFTVEFAANSNQSSHYEIVDLEGQVVKIGSIDIDSGMNQKTLDLRDLKAGLYFISISTDRTRYIQKISLIP